MNADKKSVFWRFLVLGLSAGLFASPVLAWGPEGHRIVALIAAAHLTPAAQARVTQLLRGDLANGLAAAANWADDVKGRTNTGDWHFINLAASDTKGQIYARCPRGNCVTEKTRVMAQNLRSGRSLAHGRRPFTPVEELKFVIHLMGDLHQPLHCATNADAGGNCLRISGFGSTELHEAWDTGILRRGLLRNTSEIALARAVDARFASRFSEIVKVTDYDDMAMESHAAAFRAAYGPLLDQHLLPGQEPRSFFRLSPRDCASKAADLFNITPLPNLANVYGEATFETLRQQLAAGGYRLAEVLNAAFR